MSLQLELHKLTNQLYAYNEQVLSIAEKTRNNDGPPDFFGSVKPFVDEVKQCLDDWRNCALKWVRMERPKYVHPRQIDTVYENIEKIAIEAFYKNMSLKRIKQFHQSVEFTLKLILREFGETKHTVRSESARQT